MYSQRFSIVSHNLFNNRDRSGSGEPYFFKFLSSFFVDISKIPIISSYLTIFTEVLDNYFIYYIWIL